jgi:hypothetical protein
MKLLGLTFVACLAGFALGAGAAWQHIKKPAWQGFPVAENPATPQAVPKLAVDSELFVFGVMKGGGTGSHQFHFFNHGQAPLTLKAGATSCKCTVSEVEKGILSPGDSGSVTLQWHPKEVVGRFEQNAKIITNDPIRPELVLSVSGEVTVGLRAIPPSLVLSSLARQDTAHADVRIYCYLPGQPLEIDGFKMAYDALAPYFTVTHEPIPKSDLAQEPNAQSGVLLHVGVKPGLPQGPFQQTILIATNQPDATSVAIPIEGKVSGDISVAGPDWDDDQNSLNLGAVKSQIGASRQLQLIVRGPKNVDKNGADKNGSDRNWAETRFEVGRVEPDYLHVTLGKTEVLGSGASLRISRTPLTIEVPPGSPQESHLGSEQGHVGVIVLETTDPQTPQFKVRVRFAVEGGR